MDTINSDYNQGYEDALNHIRAVIDGEYYNKNIEHYEYAMLMSELAMIRKRRNHDENS